MIGREHRYNSKLTRLERFYISIFGYPALGLRVRTRNILKLLKKIPSSQRILDAGCGNGVITFEIVKLFKSATITSVDNRDSVILENKLLAKSLNLKNCNFINSDIFDIPKTDKFDLIVSTDNLEHIENDQSLLTFFYQRLDNGGNLLLHVPHYTRSIFGFKRNNFMGIEGHVRPGYYKEDLIKMVKTAGFEIIQCNYTYNSFETLFNDISYIITGGREKNKYFYSLLFPLLLFLTNLFMFWPIGVGSGLILWVKKRNDI